MKPRKMLKGSVCVILVALMVLGLLACTSKPDDEAESTTEGSAAEFPEMTVTFSTTASESETHGQGYGIMAEYIKQATEGKVNVEIYYTSSLFAQDQEVPSIMSGDLDMSDKGGGLLSDYMPTLGMFDSGYTFKNYDHWKAWYDSDDWEEYTDVIADEIGIRIIGECTTSGRTINLREDRKVTSRADLADTKMRMPNTPSYLFLGEALGTNPIPMGTSEIYVALQTGTVDGQDNPIAAIKQLSYYEVTKSVTLSGHVQATFWIVINEDLWQTFSPELQKVFKDAAQKAGDYIKTTSQANLESDIAYLEENRVAVYELTDEELTAYAQEVKDYYTNSDFIKDWDMDIYNLIQTYAE